MLTGITAIIFDLDGTLYVSLPLGREIMASAVRYLAELRGMSVTAAQALIRETKREMTPRAGAEASLSVVCLELGGTLQEMHRRFAAEIEPERHLTRDERVVELLRTLGATRELVLYTNNNRFLATRITDLIGITGLFPKVITIEDTWRPKPDRETLEKLLRQLGRAPAECLFVGDRYDIDLRLPASLGCAVYHTRTIDELLMLDTPTE